MPILLLKFFHTWIFEYLKTQTHQYLNVYCNITQKHIIEDFREILLTALLLSAYPRLGPHHSAVRRMFRESFREAAHDPMFWAERKAYGPDQGFLKRSVLSNILLKL